MATLLISLRLAPTLSFAPPFTLLRIPGVVRLLLSVCLAAFLVAVHPLETWQSEAWKAGLFWPAITELLLGLSLALCLQLAFASLLVAGRSIDLQAGFGLASVLDPSTRSQLPLVGTLFVYAAGVIFFATDGPADLLAIWSASVEQIPLGKAALPSGLAPLATYVSAVFLLAMGAGGLAMMVLFLVDLAITFMSRTLPQMNVLVLGFQVKTLVVLAVLPVSISLSMGLFLRLIRYALQTASELV